MWVAVADLALLVVLRRRGQCQEDVKGQRLGESVLSRPAHRLGQIDTEDFHLHDEILGVVGTMGSVVEVRAEGAEQLARLGEVARRVVGEASDGLVEAKEHGHLKEHRQTPGQGVHIVLFVEGHHGLIERLAIVLVLSLEPFQLWLQSLHGQHGSRALDGKWRQNEHDNHSQKNDGDAIVRN